MIIEFGKYKGQHISNIPESYLTWLEGTKTDELNKLRDAMADRGLHTHSETKTVYKTAGLSALQLEMMEAGYKKLAQKRHPDHGGTNKAMQELNDAMARARRAVEESDEL